MSKEVTTDIEKKSDAEKVSSGQVSNSKKFLSFVKTDDEQVSPYAIRYLASLAIAGEAVPEVVGRKLPDSDIRHKGEVVKTRLDVQKDNLKKVQELNVKAKELKIIGSGNKISKKERMEIKEYLLSHNPLGNFRSSELQDYVAIKFGEVEKSLEEMKTAHSR